MMMRPRNQLIIGVSVSLLFGFFIAALTLVLGGGGSGGHAKSLLPLIVEILGMEWRMLLGAVGALAAAILITRRAERDGGFWAPSMMITALILGVPGAFLIGFMLAGNLAYMINTL